MPQRKPRRAPRPMLPLAAIRGLQRMIDAVPSSILLSDPDVKAAADWCLRYLEWYTSPAEVEKRKQRGDQIRTYMSARRKKEPTP